VFEIELALGHGPRLDDMAGVVLLDSLCGTELEVVGVKLSQRVVRRR